MTAAAGIKIGTSGTSAQGQVKALGTGVHGAGQPATVAQGLLSPSVSGTESFGAGWQSLLASLGCGAAGSGELESSASQGKVSTEKGAAGSSTSTSSLADGAALGLRLAAGEKDGVTNLAAELSKAVARTGLSAARQTASDNQTASLQANSTPTEEKKSAANSKAEASSKSEKTESTSGRHSTATSNGVNAEGLTAVSMPEAVPAAVSLSLSAPVSAVVSPALKTADEQLQSARTDLLDGSSTGSSSAVFGEIIGISGQAKESESLAHQEAALPASSLSESSSQTLGKADSSAADEEFSSAAVTRAANESPLKTRTQTQSATQGQSATQTLTALKPNSTQTAASAQEAAGTLVAEPSATHGATSIQNSSQASAQNPMALPASTPGSAVASTAASASTKSPEISSLESSPVSASLAAAQSGQSAAASAAAGSDSASSRSKSSTSGTLRIAHGADGLASAQHGVHLSEGQSSGTAVDASAVARQVAGAHGTASTAGSATGTSSATAGGTTAGETFAALDADTSMGKPTWVHAGAQQAEAGFQDSSLGWVSVRADASGGGVHAELVAGSLDAAQALGSHMAGLSAYLAEHQTPVDTLTLSSSGGGSAASGSGQGAGDQMQQGTGQQPGQQQGQQKGQETVQGAAAGLLPSSSSGSTALAADASQSSAWSGRSDGSAYAATSGGVHISVVA
jgi:hypothetical protein